MELFSHITLNEIAAFVGVFLLGVAGGAALVWEMVRRRLG